MAGIGISLSRLRKLRDLFENGSRLPRQNPLGGRLLDRPGCRRSRTLGATPATCACMPTFRMA